jgi:hypothetical protein
VVGVFLSYAALVGAASAVDPRAVAPAAVAATAVAEVCALGGPACEADVPEALGEDPGPLVYATPAEIDCPASDRGVRVVRQPELPASAGDCSPPSLDFHYRVSRAPESERPNGALRPQRARRPSHRVAACTGLPLERGSLLSLVSLQPMATYAIAGLVPPLGVVVAFEDLASGTVRALEPLDRPPRA